MEQVYCCVWQDAQRKAMQVIPPERAEALHRMGESYTVVFYVQNRVRYAVTVSKNGVTVRFYNPEQMPECYYEYQPADADRMFLRTVTYFICDGERITLKQIASYSPRGLLTETECDLDKGTEKTEERPVDLSHNWERYPEFDDYDHLLVQKSDLP